MSRYALRSPEDADAVLADRLHQHYEPAAGTLSLRLEVREDACFGADAWVAAGAVTLHPEAAAASQDGSDAKASVQRALRYGFFDWTLPTRERLESDLIAALELRADRNPPDRETARIREAANAVAHAALRCGLAHPMIDAMVLSRMPFRNPVSVVADTSAVLQGGLDFVTLHLAPAARITIPAVVHMEILNLIDRYFTQRRAGKPSARMLQDHVLSQAGQRVLLRLERDHQLERARIGADPLRGIIQPDSDAEDRSLGLQRVQRSFADRLILETAIQRRNRVDPNHPVMLMTADQGQARMALAEGIEPMFFDASGVSHLFGTTLSGVTFRPFTDRPRTHSVALTRVLWELAVAFGRARAISVGTGDGLDVAAIGQTLSWQPYHSVDDLLWTAATGTTPVRARAPVPTDEGKSAMDRSPSASAAKARAAGSYGFSPYSMLKLMVAVASAPVSDDDGMSVVGVRSMQTYVQYFRFLLAGDFVTRRASRLIGTEPLSALLRSMATSAFDDMRGLLAGVASFEGFLSRLNVGNPLTKEESGLRKVAFAPYCALAEACCAGVFLAGSGIFATPRNPPPDQFAAQAAQAYDAVREGEDFALTGAWLEHLVRHMGIHPVRARQRLAEAQQGGYVRRFVEGSTPETRYENRTLHVLHVEGRVPGLRRVNLYHGDFLIPGTAAGSIRLGGTR